MGQDEEEGENGDVDQVADYEVREHLGADQLLNEGVGEIGVEIAKLIAAMLDDIGHRDDDDVFWLLNFIEEIEAGGDDKELEKVERDVE
jgi:hypothetical protein